MKNILPYIVVVLLAVTKDLKTASADNLRAPEAGGPTQTDVSDGLMIHMNDEPAQRKLKKKGKAKGGKAKGGKAKGGGEDVCSDDEVEVRP